jgi:ribosome-associated protein
MKDLTKEIKFTYSRSSGKGGQNVNKVETKVELYFDIKNSVLLNDDEKSLLNRKLANRIDSYGILHITSQTERTQLGNKKKVTERFIKIIRNALKKEKIRLSTKPTKSSKEKRIIAKKKLSEKKKVRKSDFMINYD